MQLLYKATLPPIGKNDDIKGKIAIDRTRKKFEKEK